VRPASREEIKRGKVTGTKQEMVGSDDNIYAAVKVPGEVHFFRTERPFPGQYLPEWKRKELHLPLGLIPTEAERLRGLELTVKARTEEYLLLDERGSTYVFYFGGPDLAEVFNDAGIADEFYQRELIAEELSREPWMVVDPADNLPDLMGRSNHWVWADEYQQGSAVIGTQVRREGTWFDLEGRPFPLKLNSEADYILYDAGCVQRQRESYLDSLAQIIAQQEYQLETFAQAPSAQWIDNQDLQRHLGGRFGVTHWPSESPLYRHLAFPRYDYQSCLYPELRANGEVELISRFVSDSGLFHSEIMVLIGGDTLRSSRVPTYDPKSDRRYVGDRVVEELRLVTSGDQEIVEAIAKSGEKALLVQYIAGGDYYQELALPQIYRSLIRDAWLYGQLLQRASEQR
ncbi:MAG: hypothetical protein AAF804_17855, partial [Bacteroidota bacterium]